MRIIFMRHGESEFNASENKGEWSDDTKLTKKGEKQAEATGKKLKKYNLSEIYTSNLERAKKTGEIISKITKVPVKENLQELDEFWAEDISSKFKSNLSIKLAKRKRKLKKFLDKVSKNKEEDKTILIVAHGITNRLIMGYFVGFRINDKILRFSQHNACINVINWNPRFKNWSIECINEIEHLPIELRKGELR